MTEPNTRGPSPADHVGEAAGGITGALTGAAIGATAGPIGSLIGGVAGAIGGWWSGRAIAEAAEDITEADEQFYREHASAQSETTYDDGARGAYYLGVVAAANPEYAGRNFEEIEPELSRGWDKGTTGHGDWKSVSPYALMGFNRGVERRRQPRRRE
jgi:hypothetical protein